MTLCIGTLPYFRGNENPEVRIGLFVHTRIKSAVNRVGFINDNMICITLTGFSCEITFLNVHTATKNNSDNTKGSFYEKLEHVFYKLEKNTKAKQ
jgi:hypothetical protein